jgi:hypothetical protein
MTRNSKTWIVISPRKDRTEQMGTFDKFRAAFGDMAIRSVHDNVARLDAARAFLKSEDWPPNVVSIGEARAQRLKRRRHGRFLTSGQ